MLKITKRMRPKTEDKMIGVWEGNSCLFHRGTLRLPQEAGGQLVAAHVLTERPLKCIHL